MEENKRLSNPYIASKKSVKKEEPQKSYWKTSSGVLMGALVLMMCVSLILAVMVSSLQSQIGDLKGTLVKLGEERNKEHLEMDARVQRIEQNLVRFEIKLDGVIYRVTDQ